MLTAINPIKYLHEITSTNNINIFVWHSICHITTNSNKFNYLMKVLLLIVSVLLYCTATATTYYISPSGNDATGTGTINSPWRTLFKACQSVNTTGDIIHVNAGTYVETAQSLLAVGVSIEGDGITSVIKSTLTAQYVAILSLNSLQGTSGNQHISNIKFDGQYVSQSNSGTSWAIHVMNRSNVSVHDITVVNFFERGVIFSGAFNVPLTIYATGNTFYNNTVINSGGNVGYGHGCLEIGGQDGMLIHDNILTQDSRADGWNGWPIKYIDDGHFKNVKMYNNTFTKNMQSGFKAYIDWPFAMELYHLEGGNEFYNNTSIGGGFDVVFMTKGTSTYSVWIHDNNISVPVASTVATQMGVTCENLEAPDLPDIRDIIIERNTFTNLNLGVYFTPRNGTIVNNIIIRNNLMQNHSGFGQVGAFINFSESGGATTFTNIDVLNNTLIANPSAPFYTGIMLPSTLTTGVVNNINIKNNIIAGGSAGAIFYQSNAVAINNLHIENNDFYNNNLDTDFRTSPAPTNYTFTNNLHITPSYGANFTLQAGSPLIDAGVNVGIAYTGAAPDIGYKEFGNGNAAPVVNAGANQTITLPTTSLSITGSATDDHNIVSHIWTKVSGTGGTIVSPSNYTTLITGLSVGSYTFRLSATDDSSATSFDDMIVTVNAAVNIAPTANAGVDQFITLPTNSASLTGSGNDPDGTITAYVWTKVSGPTAGTITNAVAASTTVTGLTAGIYKFELRVTDNGGAFGRDTMQVTVNAAAANTPPTANAGPDQSITLPTSAVNLSGSGTDANGTISAYLWTKISGPTGAGTITNAASAATSVTALIAGIYKFELRVTDNGGAFGRDTMQVIVFAPNLAPVANAGLDQSISLPTNTTNLSGSGTDADGTIAAYKWTKISGPAGETITNSILSGTTVSGLSAGIYVFELKVTDNNGATGTDMMQVTVNPENIPPVANAGLDQSIILPTNTVTLIGRGSDVDGTIVSFKWRQVSGPVDKLTSVNTAITVLDNLIEGTYKLELTVTDNKGATGKDTVSVNVANVTAPTQNKIKVYPNPIVDFTTLEINSINTIDNSPLLVVITDMQGKTVYTKKLNAGSYTVKEKLLLNNLSNGTYLITVYFSSTDKQTITAIKL